MSIRVSKEFRFEAAHRLPWHEGLCANLHGHSYVVTVSLTGKADDRGMVIDFQHIKALVKPLIDAWDHAVLIAEYDIELRDAIAALGSRHVVVPGDTTAENMARFIADHILEAGREELAAHAIESVGVGVRETATSEAWLEVSVPR